MNRSPSSFIELASRGGACAMLMLFCGGSFGQDALRSALEGNTAYRARTAPASPTNQTPSTAGPTQLRVSTSYELEWTDNLRLTSTNAEADFSHAVQANLHATWRVTQYSTLNFGLGAGYQVYARNSDLDRPTITPDSELAWDISVRDLVFTLYDRFNYSQDVVSQGAISGRATFPRIENTAGLRARWYPAQYAFELGYGHYNFISESGIFDYLSRQSEQFFGSAGWRFAAATVAGAEASASLTDYDQSLQSTNRNNRNVSVGPFLEWQVTPWFSVSLRGGVVYYSFESPTATDKVDLMSYYVNFETRHRATEFLSHGLILRRDVQQGVNEGSQVIEMLSARYSIAWAFHRNASLSTAFWYEQSREPNVEEFDRYGLSFGLKTQPFKHVETGLSYRHALKDSNVSWRDYRQSAVVLNISYVF